MKPVVVIIVAAVLMAGGGLNGSTIAATEEAKIDAGTALVALPEPKTDGERLFDVDCAICHAGGKLYPGYFALRRLGAPEPELAKRTGMDAGYIKAVVRNGLGGMAPFTPTHVSDADLDAIAAYLSRGR